MRNEKFESSKINEEMKSMRKKDNTLSNSNSISAVEVLFEQFIIHELV
jgi:hypothetical protein